MYGKVVIYWDIDTCPIPVNSMHLVIKSIRELCATKNYIEDSFICYTTKPFDFEKELNTEFNIKLNKYTEQLKHINCFYDIQFELNLCQKSLILITGETVLIRKINLMTISNPIVLIYGNTIDIQSIQLTPNIKCLKFLDFCEFSLNYDTVLQSFSNLTISGQTSNDNSKEKDIEFNGIKNEIQKCSKIIDDMGTLGNLFKGFVSSITSWIQNNTEQNNSAIEPKNQGKKRQLVSTEITQNKKKKKGPDGIQKYANISGVRGLQNLGNTCYMNSGLQCLSNIQILTEFVTKKNNYSGKCSQKTLIAIYSDLMKNMWSGQFQTISPTQFKTKVGQLWSQFKGYGQNDCSELLTSVLDHFHEELIQNKQKNESTVYQTFDEYLKNNNTFITQNFKGFLRFRVFCESGHSISQTYDPFLVINLPQIDKRQDFSVFLVTNDGKHFKIEMKSNENFIFIRDVFKEVADTIESVNSDNLIAVVIKDHKINKTYETFEYLKLNSIDGFVCIYERDPSFQRHLFVILNDSQPFGIPLLLNVNSITYNEIIEAFVEQRTFYFRDLNDENISQLYATQFYEFDEHLINYLNDVFVVLPKNYQLTTKSIGFEIRSKYRQPLIVERKSSSFYKASDVKLDETLKQFLSVRQITDPIKCEKCQKSVLPKEKTDILYAPNVLMLQLKSNPKKQNYRESNSCEFPLVMDFSDHISLEIHNRRDYTYDLVAVSNYTGSSFYGHYTAYAKNHLNNKWYEFNDNNVSEINESQLNSSKAYLLFYVKR